MIKGSYFKPCCEQMPSVAVPYCFFFLLATLLKYSSNTLDDLLPIQETKTSELFKASISSLQ